MNEFDSEIVSLISIIDHDPLLFVLLDIDINVENWNFKELSFFGLFVFLKITYGLD